MKESKRKKAFTNFKMKSDFFRRKESNENLKFFILILYYSLNIFQFKLKTLKFCFLTFFSSFSFVKPCISISSKALFLFQIFPAKPGFFILNIKKNLTRGGQCCFLLSFYFILKDMVVSNFLFEVSLVFFFFKSVFCFEEEN